MSLFHSASAAVVKLADHNLRDTTLSNLLRCTKPIYKDLQPSTGRDEFSFLGTGFTARFYDRWYFITAGHVVPEEGPDLLRVFDPETGNSLPFKGYRPRESSNDQDDVAIFEIDISLLESAELSRLKPIRIDPVETVQLKTLPPKCIFAAKGYPVYRGQVDLDAATLNQRSFELTAENNGQLIKGVYNVRYFPENKITDLNGMSGAPWVVVRTNDVEWLSLLAGVHISASQSGADISGNFASVNMLIEKLKKAESN
jgi:hypothetical protein